MSISTHQKSYLDQAHVHYDVISHAVTTSALQSAQAARLPISNVVKAVILKDQKTGDYVIAAIPASNKLKISWVNSEINRKLEMADETELTQLFPDCLLGAVPGFGQAYQLDIIWDDQLQQQRNLYFEAGNHQELIHISKQQFIDLFASQPHSVISLPATSIADTCN